VPDKKEQKSKKLPEKTTQTRKSKAGKAAEHDMFPIVAIGASAGGLEALQQFFNNMPPDSGMAFVVITHLDPKHASRMAELLQKNTEMRVFEAQDNAKIQPDTVYVIPPHRNILVMNRTLQLLEQPLSPGLSHTIDIFFRSLSEDLKDRAICIVLSGTGTDGTSGLRAVKTELGMAIAQDPGSAAYQGMPSSAIETGLVDYVLSPAEMPARLIEYVRDFYGKPAAMRRDAVERVPGALQKIFVLMRSQFRVDFSAYKEATLRRRLERRMALHQLTDLRQYLRLLQESPEELITLYKDFLINVTNFFRDADAFISLKAKLSLLIKEKPEGSTFRAWMVGCSSGEETYSVAMLIRECIDEQKRNLQMQIFGTDIDQDAINTARTGTYPQNIISDITPERLSQFFVSKDSTYQVKKDIREAVIFSYQNALKDPPFSKIDLLVCRNLLIYLKPDVQRKLLALFHYALNPGGILFLGTSETVSGFGEQYAPLDRKWRIYNRRPVSLSNWVASDAPMVFAGARDAGAQIFEGKRAEKQSISDLAEKLLSSVYVPPAVVVNRNKEIIYIHGETGRFLTPASGQPRWNIQEMAREGLGTPLTAAIRKAIADNSVVSYKGIQVGYNGGTQIVDITVQPLHTATEPLLLVTFQSVPDSGKKGKRSRSARIPEEQCTELEQELKLTRGNLQTIIEELETSNEELKSSNEEYQSTLEELQSTNEELETSREELQSINEELMTTNSECQSNNEELTHVRDDMKNLLDNIRIAVVFLDGQLRVVRFTVEATKLLNLYATDEGRPLAHVTSNMIDDTLVEDARKVLDTLIPVEREVKTTNGKWFLLRLMPYRTIENAVAGVVLTFTDINVQKDLNETLKNALDFSQNVIDTLPYPFLVLDKDLRVTSVNRAFSQMFKTTPKQTERKLVYELGNKQWDIPELRRLLEEILPRDKEFNGFLVEHEFPTIGLKKFLLNARRLHDSVGTTEKILLALDDITNREPANPGLASRKGPTDGTETKTAK